MHACSVKIKELAYFCFIRKNILKRLHGLYVQNFTLHIVTYSLYANPQLYVCMQNDQSA